ncbi:hypothetical protein ACWDA9_37540, partial [Streptomyces sp. NPDC001193]
MVSAIIYERERGSSWTEIAQYLGIGPAEAEERFAAMLDDWNTAFEVPYRLDDTVRKRDHLKTYRGGFVVISHDVDLVETVVNKVFYLDAN